VEFALQTRGAYAQLAAAARWAEERRLAALALPDHYLAGRAPDGNGYDTRSADIYPYLGALASVTTSLELAALVSPLSYRHPGSLLKLGLAVDEVSGGRFTLGVGTGWFEAEHTTYGFDLPDWPERFDRLEEGLGYIRTALNDGADGFAGSFYHLAPVDHQPKGANLRILVGGSGPRRTPVLAGRFADEFNIYSQTSDRLRLRIERARQAAAAAGRDPASLLLSCASPPIIGADEAEYRARLAAFAALRGVEAGLLERQARDTGVPMGTHEEARDAFGPLASLGIGRYYLQVLGGFDADYAAEVIDVLGAT
jgi:alkanesulfonate monooxygenase SsuD/methylene tetrahydromethanopterin reductase-like flavin-dependent oxidoreductase (luciferase family)